MSGNIINFNDKKIQKSDFYNKSKKTFNTDDIDVNKIIVSIAWFPPADTFLEIGIKAIATFIPRL